MYPHRQLKRNNSVPFASTCKVVDRFSVRGGERSLSFTLPVDQFFSQKQNLVNGHIDTSPIAASSPSSAEHVAPVGAERPWPADTPDSVIMGTIISKHCQSPAEMAVLHDFRPVADDYVDGGDSSNSDGDNSVSE